ncbi:MAG: hypothetical protein Q9168_007337 [Polycauliona sp. 1 TL-2023]
MDMPQQRPAIIDITDDSGDDQDAGFERFMDPEDLLDIIPDAPPSPPHHERDPLNIIQQAPTQTVARYDQCLRNVLEVFPDVSRDYVQNLYDGHPPNTPPADGIPVFESIISTILDSANYPKERDRQNELKRKRADSDGERAAQWASHTNVARPEYEHEAVDALVDEFPDIPRKFIELKFRETGNLYAVYLALDIADDTFDTSAPRPYNRLKKARRSRAGLSAASLPMVPTGYGLNELQKELEAARAQRKKLQTKRQIKKDALAAEAAHEQELRDNDQVMECGSCFEQEPINKITHCNGEETHYACFECATTWVKTKIGESRYQLPCIVGSECTATYSRQERMRFLEPQMIERLERLEQQTCLREANLPNLEECPFCDFAAECPPIEVDKEFRCGNSECQKVSCRRCKVATHIPLSCEEFKKENGLTERHLIEEARTQALLRQCTRCKKTIMKEGGCNKLTCSCGAYICDFCGKDITSQLYGHFSDGPGSLRTPGSKKCPTYDNDYTRNNANMDAAEKEAVEKVRKENPDISEEDLKIKMKESVRSPRNQARQLGGMAGMPLPGMLPPGMPPRAVADMMERRQQAMLGGPMAMAAAGYPAGAFAFPHRDPRAAYYGPNLGGPPPPVGHPMGHHAPQQAAPQAIFDAPPHRHGLHLQPQGYVPAPRRHAVAEQGGRMPRPGHAGGGHAGGHHAMYPGGAPINDFDEFYENNFDHHRRLDAYEAEMDDFMAEYMALEEAGAGIPRRRRH